MGLPSLQADIEESALDYRLAGLVLEDRFRPGNVGSSPVRGRVRRPVSEAILMRARQAEMEAQRLQAWTRQFVKDLQLWRWATRDVKPLRRR